MDKAIDNERVRKEIYQKMPIHSAYRSAQVIKEYKKRGGEFKDDGKERKLTRWFKEE